MSRITLGARLDKRRCAPSPPSVGRFALRPQAEEWKNAADVATQLGTVADRLVVVPGTTGSVLAIAVSVGLFVTLPLRDVDYNALNLFTIVLATVAGLLAIRGARRQDGAGLGWGSVLLFVAIVPAVFGWVVLLYLPSLLFVVAAAARFVTKPA